VSALTITVFVFPCLDDSICFVFYSLLIMFTSYCLVGSVGTIVVTATILLYSSKVSERVLAEAKTSTKSSMKSAAHTGTDAEDGGSGGFLTQLVSVANIIGRTTVFC